MMKRLMALFLIVISGHALAHPADTTVLQAKKVFGREASIVMSVLSQAHYRKLMFGDSLSSVAFDRYFSDLDNSRLYFLQSDVDKFSMYRNRLDDMTRAEDVSVAFEIYKVFQERYRTRLRTVINKTVTQEFDFSVDEYYDIERDKAPWAKSPTELDDLWRKVVKNQALSLKISGKKQEEIVDLLKKRYERLLKSYDQLNSEDVFSIYMNCMTEAYDPHTNYLSPKATDLFNQQMTLSLEGIGARLQTDNDYTKVADIIPGGPAEKSGELHPNDLITGVAQGADGEMVDVVGWRIDDVVKLIKGPKGTTVRLQVMPVETGVNGPAKILTLVRDKVKLEDQAAKKKVITYNSNGKSLKMGIISLPAFYMDFAAYQKGDPNYRSTTRDVRKLIGELKTEKVDGIIMDLRNNGGGSLMEAIDLTGLFIKQGPVVQVRDYTNKIEPQSDEDAAVAYDGPLIVLTNRFSASASEIFAAAIQDYKRGVIVGESTFGKGTVQTVVNLDRWVRDREKVGEMKFTIQKFYRVTGSSTQHKGVTPDISLPSALSPEQFGESASPNALPWDVIRKVDITQSNAIDDKTISALTKNYLERMKFDASLKQYASEMSEMKRNLSETRVSLNEAKRRQEIDAAEKRKKANETMNTKVTSKEGLPMDDLTGLKDEPLREGLLILADLVTRRIG